MENDIENSVSILESHLDGTLDRIKNNNQILKRFQSFEKILLNINSLAEMIEHILGDAKSLFNLDIISLCLIDENSEISTFLRDDGYDYLNTDGLILLDDNELLKTTFGLSSPRPFLGAYKQSNCTEFFPKLERKPLSIAIIPLYRRGKYLGSLNLGSYSSNRFISDMATDFIEHMVSVVSICLENNLNFEMMRRTSHIDTLTGVNNRRFLEQRIGEELDRSQRSNEPLSCLFLDIDHFKSINDTYGHQAGDYVLSSIASLIKKQLRNNDVLARYGGEEFVALLSNINEIQGKEIAERIRLCTKEQLMTFKGTQMQVTISIGLSTYLSSRAPTLSTNDIASQLISSADKALYCAKDNGRDGVEIGKPVYDTDKVSQQLAS